jgi:tetratricopeptide (TPR) repeat protein
MSMTLNLVDSLLHQGQKLHKLGRIGDAQRTLLRLTALRKLPAEVAETSHALLAEIYLKRRQHRRARRALTAALGHQPESAQYHYLIAKSWQEDEQKGDNEKAREHYARSLEFDPEQPDCLSRLGFLQVELGDVDEGLERLKGATELAPDNPAIVQRYVDGLRLADRSDDARAVLLAARFRNARDPRFHKLWNDFQFEELRQSQEHRRGLRIADCGDDPVLLPFPDSAQPMLPFRKIG